MASDSHGPQYDADLFAAHDAGLDPEYWHADDRTQSYKAGELEWDEDPFMAGHDRNGY
jgi:hypothetical protein